MAASNASQNVVHFVKSPPNILMDSFGNFVWHAWWSGELSWFLGGMWWGWSVNSGVVTVFLWVPLRTAWICIIHNLIFLCVLSACWTLWSSSSSGVKFRIFPSSGKISSTLLFNDLFSCLNFTVLWLVDSQRVSSTCVMSRVTEPQWAPLTCYKLR